VIRNAEYRDIPAILDIGQWYLDHIHPGTTIDREAGPKDLRYLISSATGWVGVAEKGGEIVGALAGQVVRQSFVKQRYATDVGFVVLPGHPIQAVGLARHFIHWSRQQKGVRDVTLQISSGLANVDRVGKLYEKLGLRHMGGCYTMFLEG